MMKRLLTLLLILCSLTAMLPVGALAAAPEVSAPNFAYRNYLPDVPFEPTEEAVSTVRPRSTENYLSEKDAKAYMRKQLKARNTSFTVNYYTSDYDANCVTTMIESVLYTHTGVPTEGDYILRNLQRWQGGGKVSTKNGKYYLSLNYTITYHTTAAQEAKVDAAVEELLAKLKLGSKTPYQKVKGIYDYITSNVTYDFANLYDPSYTLKYTTYAALINGTSVCQGFASLFYRLALELGVDCRYISGTSDGEPHGWNIVELDGKYYNLDATWDEGKAESGYSWFLKGSANFKDHTRSSEFDSAAFHTEYPTSAKDYNPTTKTVKITKQPVSVRVASGKTASVKVTATGDGLTYKWYYADKGASKFTYTKSFKANTYSLKMTSARNGRRVYCVVTDQYGNSAKSNTVTLNMGNPVKITKQPATAVVGSGKTASVKVTATGDGLTYKWYYADKGASKFTYTKSFKTNTYSLKMTSAKSGRRVYCVVTDKYGNSVKSDVVTLYRGKPAKITKQPANVSAYNGSTATVKVTATGDGLTYKWYYAEPGSSKFTYTKSFKSNTYSVKMTSARNGRRVYCVITDKYGTSVKTKTVTLSRRTTLSITTQPKNVSVASGATAKVTVKATGDGLTYKWYYAEPGSSKFTYTKSFTGSSYSVKMTSAKSGRRVYCVVTDKYGKSVKSNVVTLSQKTAVDHSRIVDFWDLYAIVEGDGTYTNTESWYWWISVRENNTATLYMSDSTVSYTWSFRGMGESYAFYDFDGIDGADVTIGYNAEDDFLCLLLNDDVWFFERD